MLKLHTNFSVFFSIIIQPVIIFQKNKNHNGWLMNDLPHLSYINSREIIENWQKIKESPKIRGKIWENQDFFCRQGCHCPKNLENHEIWILSWRILENPGILKTISKFFLFWFFVDFWIFGFTILLFSSWKFDHPQEKGSCIKIVRSMIAF